MITNRTQYDIDTAIDIIKEKVQKFEELSQSDIDVLERGTMTINTLNRIENKQEELKNLFNEMGYWNTDITNKFWDYTQIFNVDEFQRILDNTNVLREAFFVYSTTPKTPPISYNYNDINALEKILFDLDVMINNIKSNYKICGVAICENL